MCFCLRLPQLLSTCVAFSLVFDRGILWGDISYWFMFSRCFCFILTLIISILELLRLQSDLPFFWYNFSVTCACYATLICLSASIIYSITYVHFLPYGPNRHRAIAATELSCVACVLYSIEVACTWDCYGLKEITRYVHTVPGLLKVLETFVVSVIFTFLSNTSLYLHQPALEWCVAVYSICFILSSVAILLNLGKWEYRLPVPFPIIQLGLSLLSILLYISTLVLWPLYQFNQKLGGQPQRLRDVSCSDELTYNMCTWDQRLAVATLTTINLLLFVADLVYWAHQVSAGTEDQPRDS
ncbi:myeloid-associated differentiation marker-like [Hippopotamus amphibius kiboko]|uniref:myeloid-associated differentiation marker-like n=1 Tax=Hippopotamus amphibius kiboko TaxID=575201 RepID=UPI002591F167|nr:myeloid-associated differentiation marker-like [Hippopotamus amphibius kiboko]